MLFQLDEANRLVAHDERHMHPCTVAQLAQFGPFARVERVLVFIAIDDDDDLTLMEGVQLSGII